MPPHSFDKRACLARAEQLLKDSNDSVLRYVCLELRFCLEAVAYDKLRTYAKRLPESVLKTWQPPQAIRALLEFEPLADRDFQIRICRENEEGLPTDEWVTLGTHRTLRLSWLRETYNKLGSYLHVPGSRNDMRTNSSSPLQPELQEIINHLKPVVDSSIDCSIDNVLYFTCSVCDVLSFANIEGVRRRKEAVCLNPNCQSEFCVGFNDAGDPKFLLKSSIFECFSCGRPIRIENRKLKIGLEFQCQECYSHHRITSRQWEYECLDQDKPSTS